MGIYRNLIVFQKAYALAMEIFVLSRSFPSEERFGLTDQIRRSSRSVCTNLAEAYKRRHYQSYFISKLTDCSSENTEVEVWLYFAKDCGYISQDQFPDLLRKNEEVGKMIYYMMANPEKFI